MAASTYSEQVVVPDMPQISWRTTVAHHPTEDTGAQVIACLACRAELPSGDVLAALCPGGGCDRHRNFRRPGVQTAV
jgi:hypothetical protein